jgi:hypothetical protein
MENLNLNISANVEANKEDTKYQFYWNSHEDPWTNERWTPYHYSVQEAMEEEYQKHLLGKQEETFCFGQYMIDFDTMCQIHKKDNFKQRQIRRELPSSIDNPYNLIRPIVLISSNTKYLF